MNYPKVLDEDSSDALSPEQPASQESQSSVPSPLESKMPETPSPVPAPPALSNTILQVRSKTSNTSVFMPDSISSFKTRKICTVVSYHENDTKSIYCTICNSTVSIRNSVFAWLFLVSLLLSVIFQAFPVATQPTTDFVKLIATSEPPASRPAVTPAQPLTTAAPSKPGPTLVKVSTCF